MIYLVLYLIVINVIAAIVCCFDKHRAITHGWRVSEKNLFLYCLLGGSLGMYVTMKIIRHKTQKEKFMVGIPVIMIVQILLLIIIIALTGLWR